MPPQTPLKELSRPTIFTHQDPTQLPLDPRTYLDGHEEKPLRVAFSSALKSMKICLPAEIAEANFFLSSAHASFITGAALQVDGGLSQI